MESRHGRADGASSHDDDASGAESAGTDAAASWRGPAAGGALGSARPGSAPSSVYPSSSRQQPVPMSDGRAAALALAPVFADRATGGDGSLQRRAARSRARGGGPGSRIDGLGGGFDWCARQAALAGHARLADELVAAKAGALMQAGRADEAAAALEVRAALHCSQLGHGSGCRPRA
jgi:hypothetical protein